MNNICVICKMTIDHNWSMLQNRLKEKIDNTNILNIGFVSRCIYCYKTLLELVEEKDNKLYNDIIRIKV